MRKALLTAKEIVKTYPGCAGASAESDQHGNL